MAEDRYGYNVTGAGDEALAALNQFSDRLLRLAPHVEEVLEEAEKHLECPLLSIYAGILHLYAQTAEGQKAALQLLNQARAQLHNEREEGLLVAARMWAMRRHGAALDAFIDLCLRYPRDLTLLKFTEFLFYCRGQQFEGNRFCELTEALSHLHEGDPFFLSIHSFAHELREDWETARTLALWGLEGDPMNPWAHHTLSHIYIRLGELESGLEALEGYSLLWPSCHRMIESHNLWHLALMYLEALDLRSVEQVYDRARWYSEATSIGEEIDAASLLWRLDMEGVSNQRRWKRLATQINGHAEHCTIPFVSAQLVYGLVRAGEASAAREAVEAAERFASETADAAVWAIGLPLVHAAQAAADEAPTKVASLLTPVMDRIGCVGGSDAQVDLFRQLYLHSLFESGRYREARGYLCEMLGRDPISPLERRWAAECGAISIR